MSYSSNPACCEIFRQTSKSQLRSRICSGKKSRVPLTGCRSMGQLKLKWIRIVDLSSTFCTECHRGDHPELLPGQRHRRPVAEKIRRVKRWQQCQIFKLDRFASNLGNSLNIWKQGTGRNVSQGDDEFGRNQLLLGFQDTHAGRNFQGFRIPISGRTAFDHIGDVEILSIDTDAVNHLGQ